jgi:predicted nucleic acid-binding protein
MGAPWPVVLETFTFIERNARVDVALSWKDRLQEVPRLRILECTSQDLAACWQYFRRRDLHRLSAVDATSFVLMKRERIRVALAFDHHFAAAGYRLVD